MGTDRTTKIRRLRACIFHVVTYGCETWTLNKTAEKYIGALNSSATEESSEYLGQREEQINQYCKNLELKIIGFLIR